MLNNIVNNQEQYGQQNIVQASVCYSAIKVAAKQVWAQNALWLTMTL